MLLFGAPIILLGLFYFLTGGGSSLPAVDVVNLDRGPLALSSPPTSVNPPRSTSPEPRRPGRQAT